ncbi:Sua5/YciO/YrdC/YwlC family protein, partial [bacterium]
IYGLVGSALSKEVVARIYKLRKRSGQKPFIVLISSLKDLKLFGVKPDWRTAGVLKRIWPGKVSVLLPVPLKNFFYIHRGTKQIAFRLPADSKLLKFLSKTGPLVAPSANWEGCPPAKNIREAEKYFGNRPDFYIDRGTLKSLPSTLVSVESSKLRILRQGAVKIAKPMAL